MTMATAAARLAGGERQGRLMQGYLHKTSNNLCGIKGYASLIARDDTDARCATWARRILAEVEQMEAMFRSVQDLAFPRPSAPAAGTLATAATAAALAARAGHPRLRVGLRLGAAGALLLPARDLELVLGELLANAAEARPEGASVLLSTAPGTRGRVALRVADAGPGLPAALLAEAAAPFVTTKPGHLGIGLARVDTIMEMHGLPWSLANGERGGAVACLEVALGPAVGDRRRAGAQRGSHA